MKRVSLILAVLLTALSCLSMQANNFVVPLEIKAQAYPAHIELSFKNITGFTYDIYRSSNMGKSFVKVGETTADFYLDFFGKPVEKEFVFVYRILPKGLNIKDKAASKFEVRTKVQPPTDEALLDMTQRYTTRYFYDFAEPISGMARERSNDVNGNCNHWRYWFWNHGIDCRCRKKLYNERPSIADHS